MLLRLLLTLCLLPIAAPLQSADWIRHDKSGQDFPLVWQGRAASVVYSEKDYPLARIAAQDLVQDVEKVSGQRPQLIASDTPPTAPAVVVLGTLGRHPLIDGLVASGRLVLDDLRGNWESFVITTVAQPWPGVEQALVIVGSDRRGTAYGAYELSQAIGVSPWHWWADVAPRRHEALLVADGQRRFGPPSVRYRGIFINDEDWGLQPWAANTFEPENADIGPKTYQKVFELLLRLKANALWPAMHPSTRPFNSFSENARLAHEYGIVMGSSHAEPMLRNNVGEWTAPAADYNFVTNRAGVLRYWEERVQSHADFESIYTLGMRGIHDSHMVGPKTDAERVATLQEVFREQRQLLARHVNPDVEEIPQMFCAYKEVLDLYRKGLKVPEDVTIVWPDDNFGYIRNFATAAERERAGGYGVYYHASYLGRPLAYLWLNTMPPALIWQEMVKAYEHGADRMWIVNVGDLKPAEIATEFFLRLAWDVRQWDERSQPQFLREWAAREFGSESADAIAEVMGEFYTLNFQRKPEHLQWWLPGEVPRASPLSPQEIEQRLQAFAALRPRVERIQSTLSPALHDAYFQLVRYPVLAAAAANERYFHAEQYARHFNYRLALARRHAATATQADQAIAALTEHFNAGVAGGKWRHFMNVEPADNQWRSMRITPLPVPAPALSVQAEPIGPEIWQDDSPPAGFVAELIAGDFVDSHAPGDARWVTVPGLGRSGRAVTVLPFTATSRSEADLRDASPYLEYNVQVPEAGSHQLEFQFLPTHALAAGAPLRVGYSIGDGPVQILSHAREDGGAEWSRGVLDGAVRSTTAVDIPEAGAVKVRLYLVDAGVVVDRLILHRGPVARSYLGPAEKKP